MGDPAHRLLTYEDLLAADRPDGPVPEFIDGQIRHKAAPRPLHSRGQFRVAGALASFDPDEPGEAGWWLLVEPDVRLAAHRVVRPDLAGWWRTRLPDLPPGVIDLAPDWVCELLSPGHEAHDTVTRRTIYLEGGVPWYWIGSPEAHTIEAFEARGGRWVLHGAWTDGDRTRVPPFVRLEPEVRRWFRPLPP